MVAVCGGALTLVGALYDGGNSFEVEVGLRRGSRLGSLLLMKVEKVVYLGGAGWAAVEVLR